MATGYSTLTAKEVSREVQAMRKAAEKIAASPKKAREFLISAGIMKKSDKLAAAPSKR